MPDIVTRSSPPAAAKATATVETNDTLTPAAGWSTAANLHVTRISETCNGVNTATLRYDYGADMRHYDGADGPFDPLELIGKYVRITLSTSPLTYWHGLIVSDQRERRSAVDDGGVMRLTGGRQVLQCVGLAYLLDRVQVRSSVVFPNTRLRQARAFNGGGVSVVNTGEARRGNRQTALGSDSVFVFENGRSTATEWSAGDIVEHLLQYHAPKDSNGDPAPVPWKIDSASLTLLQGLKPEMPTAGRTLRELLDATLNPTRGYCWWLDYDPTATAQEPEGALVVYAQTLSPTSITLPTGDSLSANSDQASLDFDGDSIVASAAVRRFNQRRYHQVIARGAPVTSTFTVGVPETTLDPDFEAAQETDYKNGSRPDAAGPDLDDYNALTDEQKQNRNDAVRREPRLERVYSHFRIPSDWDGESGDGSGGVTVALAFPDISETGSVLTPPDGEANFLPALLRAQRATRLRKGWDYTQDPPASNTPSETEEEYLPPFAVVAVSDNTPAKLQFVDRLNDLDFAAGAAPSSATSYDLYPLANAPGIRLRSRRGLAHTLAKDQFVGAEPSRVEPELSYSTLRLTVTAEANAHAEAAWPAPPPDNVPLEKLVLDLGDRYRLDFLADNTLLTLNQGDPVTRSGSLVLQDDRESLQDTARIAYDWYQEPRAELTLALNRACRLTNGDESKQVRLGALLTTIGDAETEETINGVVSRIDYDLLQDTTTIVTFGEQFDFRGLLT